MSVSEPKHLTWVEFEALQPGDIIRVSLGEGVYITEATVASVDVKSGYINVDFPSGIRALVSLRQCYQNV